MTRVGFRPERRIAEMEDPFSRPLFASDLEVFGVETAIALAELSAPVADLNRRYRQATQARSLLSGESLTPWIGQPVRVFLRHDTVYVFALTVGRQFGMANRVVLGNIKFTVDRLGRDQTLSLRGPLQNMTTVHAWLDGELLEVHEFADTENSGTSERQQLIEQGFTGVTYRPALFSTFVNNELTAPVMSASKAVLLPGRCKLWCRDVVGFESPVPRSHLT